MGVINDIKELTIRDAVFIGNVIFPRLDYSNLDEYKEKCRLTKSVSVTLNNGSTVHRVRVPEKIFEDIDYPDPTVQNSFGSTLVMVTVPRHDVPVAIAILPNTDVEYKSNVNHKGMYSNHQESNASIVTGASKDNGANAIINVHSDSKEGGDIKLNSSNANKTAEISLVTNNAEIQADKNARIMSGAISLHAVDLNTRSNTVSSKTYMSLSSGGSAVLKSENSTTINAGVQIQLGAKNLEKAVKGDTLVDILKELIGVIKTISPVAPTTGGPCAPDVVAAEMLETIEAKLNRILSGLVKVE